jgi:RNA polymerase sigma-70 factor (ECF subfamily)
VDTSTDAPGGGPAGEPDAVIRQLSSRYATALRSYAERFTPDRATADDIVQETFIRAWHHLPQLADGRPVRPWLFRVARNLLIDADRAARARPLTIQQEPATEAGTDSGIEEILDRHVLCAALQHLSAAHQTILVETFYQGGNMATVARELGIPHGTARSRLHYAPATLGILLAITILATAGQLGPTSTGCHLDTSVVPAAHVGKTGSRRCHTGRY